MFDFSTARSLDDLPEVLRPLCSVEEGKVLLDETRIRTEEDVRKIKEAKDKERNDHNLAKAELAKYRDLGKTPEELSERLTDLESRSNAGSAAKDERIAEVLRENNRLKGELSKVSGELDLIKPEHEKYKMEIQRRLTGDALSKFVKGLKDVDSDKLATVLQKDIQLGLISLDESGEGLLCKDGTDLKEYAMSTAKTFGFMVENTPGAGNPGNGKIPAAAKQNYKPQLASIFDDETVAQLNS